MKLYKLENIHKILGGLYRMKLDNHIHLFNDQGETLISFYIDENKCLNYIYKNINYHLYSQHEVNGYTLIFGEDGSDTELIIKIKDNHINIRQVHHQELIHYLISVNHKEE